MTMQREYHETRLQVAEVLLLPHVRNGELWAIQNLLLIASEAIREGCPLPDGIANYISKALAEIHHGEKGDDAFGIKRKRGEKDNRASRQRGYCMADCIERLRSCNHLTLESATEEVATRFHVSFDTAKAAWKCSHKKVRKELEIEKKSLGAVQEVVWPG